MDPACWIWRKKSKLSKQNTWENVSTSSTWSFDQRLGAEQDQLPCESTKTSGNCQETDTCMVRACHTLRQSLQNQLLRHFRGWAMPWSAGEILDGQHQRVDIPAHARNWPPGERTWRGALLNRTSLPHDHLISPGTKLNWTDQHACGRGGGGGGVLN